MSQEAILEQIRLEVTPEEYGEIRALWKRHSLAEDARDLRGLLSTLTEDCLYEFPQTGDRWEGHEGAARFYTELLTAFPDIQFALTSIVIGPQGVWEEAEVTGTWEAEWLGRAPTGGRVGFRTQILFPWDRHARRFRGERVYFGADEQFRRAGPAPANPAS